MLPASPTSALHSLWMARAGHAAANQRRPGCGIVATPSGRTSTSTALELLLPHYSEGTHTAETTHTHTHTHTLTHTHTHTHTHTPSPHPQKGGCVCECVCLCVCVCVCV